MKKILILWIILTLVYTGFSFSLAEEDDSEDWPVPQKTAEFEEDEDVDGEEADPEETPTEIDAEEIRPDQETTVHIPAAETVYLVFVPEETDGYCFFSSSTREDTDPVAYLFNGNLDLLAANDDEDGNCNFRLSYLLENGQTYYFACENASEDECEYPVVLTKASGLMAVEAADLPQKWDHYMKLSVKAIATPGTALTYQWYQGLREETDDEEIIDDQDYQVLEGEDRDFLIITKPVPGMGYYCKVSDDLGNKKTISFFLGTDEEIDVTDTMNLEETDEDGFEPEDDGYEEAEEDEE